MMNSRLHIVLRSYGGETLKNRPPYYSKLLGLASFLRAVEKVPGSDVIFLNDGPIAPEQLALMERYGTVSPLPGGPVGLRRSYWAAITLPHRHPEWGDDDVLVLCEDDYLFREDAFVRIVEAAEQIPEASYFSVYGSRPDYEDPGARRTYGLPHRWQAAPDRTASGVVWFNQPGITSTFGGRVGAFRQDRAVFRHCMIPFRKRFLDHETCVIYQGYVPYRGWDLLLGLGGDFVPGPRGVARALVLFPFRVALNVHAAWRRQQHLLYCITPNEATHMDVPVISGDRDWLREARSVLSWAKAAGLEQVADALAASLSHAEHGRAA